MRFDNVCLEAFGYELPPDVHSSSDIEGLLKPLYDRLKMSIGRLELMTGIKERRFWPDRKPPSTYAIRAGEKAIRASGIDRGKIGCLIHASVCRDFLEPATATYVHNKLKLREDAFAFDLSNACLGVMNGMIVVANMIELGQIEAGLVVAAEDAKSLMENTVRKLLNTVGMTRKNTKSSLASLTIGSGAVAVLLTNKTLSASRHDILGGAVLADSSSNDLCRSTPDCGFASGDCNPIMHTDSESMLIHGCNLAKHTFDKFLKNLDWTLESIDRVVTHQVGKMHRLRLLEALGVDESKDFPTLEFLGNVGSVSLPISLALAAEKGEFKKGDHIAMLGIGSGMNSLMLGINW